MRKRQELEYVPLGLEAAQHLPKQYRGFLLRFLRALLRGLCDACQCSCCRRARDGEVEEHIIEF